MTRDGPNVISLGGIGHSLSAAFGGGIEGMPVLEVPGARLNYRTAGDGPPLVLVHGSATDMTTWDGVVDELAREHHVVVYDRRGYGQSRHKPVRDHRIHAQDLTAVLAKVAGQPATVVGWSSGGNIALAVAVKHPELFSALVIVEAPFHGMRHYPVARQRPDIRTVRIAGAGHLVHLDRPADFIAAVRSASTPPMSPTASA